MGERKWLSSGVAPKGVEMNRDEFLTLLTDLQEWLRANDSMEGSLAYEQDGPDTYRVQCGLRFGNSMGQGSIRVLNADISKDPA